MTSLPPTLPPDIILEILTSPAFNDMSTFFNLLRCTMLDRTWRSLIYSNPILRTSLFLAPLPPALSSETMEPGTRHIKSAWNYPLHRAGYQPVTIDSVHFHFNRSHKITRDLHPIFQPFWDEDRGARGDFDIPHALANYPGGLFAWVRETQSVESVWWDMFVTSPPTTRFGFTVHQGREKPTYGQRSWWHDSKHDVVLVEEWWHEREEGVRIRDVVKILYEEELPEVCREGDSREKTVE